MRLRQEGVFIICFTFVAAGALKGAEEINEERVLSRRKRGFMGAIAGMGAALGLVDTVMGGLNLAESMAQTAIMEADLANNHVQTDLMRLDMAQNLVIWKEQKRLSEETLEQEGQHHSEVIKQNRILADETAAQMDALQKAELVKIEEIYRKENADQDRRNKILVSELSHISGTLNDIADILRHQHLHKPYDFIESTTDQFYNLPTVRAKAHATEKRELIANSIERQEKHPGDAGFNYGTYRLLLQKFVDLALDKTEDYQKIKKDYFMFSTFNQLITPLLEPFSCYPTVRRPTIPGAPISESARLELVSAYCSYDLQLTEISLKLAASCQNRKCINYYGEQDISECNVKTCDSELDLLNDKIDEMAAENTKMAAENTKMAAQIAKLSATVATVNNGLSYLQERKGAFRYYLSSSALTMVKQGRVVSFDRSEYGTGVRNGVFTAQTAALYEFTWHLVFSKYDNEGFGCKFEVRKNGSRIQVYRIDQSSANYYGHSLFFSLKAHLGVGDTIDLYTEYSKRDYGANGSGSTNSYFEGRIIHTL